MGKCNCVTINNEKPNKDNPLDNAESKPDSKKAQCTRTKSSITTLTNNRSRSICC